MTINNELKIGSLVQFDPEAVRNKIFTGCIMVVTEITSWGCKGFVQALGENGKSGGQAFYRAQFDEIVLVGQAAWMPEQKNIQ